MLDLILAMAASAAMGQDAGASQTEEAACPYVSVDATSYERGKASFSLMLDGADEPVPAPTFQWSISAGTIAAGQGTVVLMVEGKPGTPVTATVDIAGYPDGCETSASGSVVIVETDG